MKRPLLFFIIIVVVNTIFVNQTFGHANTSPPILNSESAIVIDAKTGKVLYEKDSHTKMYPASLTKIATAIYAIDKGNIEELVTVSQKARDTGGSKVYLEEGEQVTLKKLIQGLLINSGNDAGVAIAEHLSGSVEQFSADINKYFKNVIGIKDTHFKNPHGLFNPKHVTTAADLAKITQYAMNNKLFREIFGTKELDWDGKAWDTTLITHHKLMREIPYEGITGGKTGFVNQSGFTLATTAERENLSLIVITLNSNLKSEAYSDTINLLDYAFENFQTSSIPKGTTFKVDKQEYKTTKKIYFTHSLDDQVKKKVKVDGTLEIVNQNNIVITSFPLERIKKEVNKTNTEREVVKKEKEDVETNSLLENHFIKVAIYSLVFVFIATVFYHKSRKLNLKLEKKG
ncbi:MAG TPA: D-alanyl-D-alanine carboxypeptidase family protein [Virgibacillus sp.]|nr:D-alanyl-D-alanine carboxypeptidase family protein [Virgibacillus sp.]HLR67029.1 D-alanyl-D-alanine carboxypeptidase family protein [Virgibacillus sp.]